VKIGRDEFHAIIDEHARLREGFERFLGATAARGVPFFVASSGFEDYIDRVLGGLAAARSIRRIFANRLDFGGDGLAPVFPHARRYACGSCDLCKGKIVDELKAEGFRVAFVGDGLSDRCGSSRADEVFAVAGSSLERWLGERSLPYRAFRTFDDVAAALDLGA
jgi:2-hydroxy-3-keto-5-methylthiopentenyl-1-phosphate phosphatase